jgi:hypothetical protein
MRAKIYYFSLLALMCAPIWGAQAAPEQRGNLTGEISYEESKPVKNTYSSIQDATITYFEQFQAHITRLADGQSSGSIPELDEGMINYLTAVYLHCAVNFGECPMVLDAILEIDVVNSRQTREVRCPMMTKFWKYWVRNDMENRHKYMVKTGYLKVTSDFNQNKRTAYLKCQDTVQSEINSKEADSEFFKKRYHRDAPKNLVAIKLVTLLKDIRSKIPNIFVAVGAQSGQ